MISRAIVIGASAGGIEALSAILPALPAGFTVPTLIVIHLPPERDSVVSRLFAPRCQVEVKEAEDKEIIRPGVIYFAPPNYHLLVEADGSLSLSSEEPELFSRPSINMLFESAADALGSGLIGVILSGASKDGAHGLCVLAQSGGVALVQDPAGAQATAMPTAALEACPNARCLPLSEIAGVLIKLSKRPC